MARCTALALALALAALLALTSPLGANARLLLGKCDSGAVLAVHFTLPWVV